MTVVGKFTHAHGHWVGHPQVLVTARCCDCSWTTRRSTKATVTRDVNVHVALMGHTVVSERVQLRVTRPEPW